MSKYLLIIVLFLFYSCKDTNSNEQKKNTREKTLLISKGDLTTTNILLEKYSLYLNNLDDSDANSSTNAVLKFKELFKVEDKELNDNAIVLFNGFYERLDSKLNELHEKDTTNYEPLVLLILNDKKPKISKKLLEYKQKLNKNGFDVSQEEGITYIQKDRDFISKNFFNYVSQTMKEYLAQVNKENKEGFASDAGLIISPIDFAERMIWYENFIKINSKFYFIANCNENYKNLLTYSIIGMDNSPVFDNETNKLSEYYEEMYVYLIKKHNNSKTTNILRPYYLALKNNQSKVVEKILDEYKSKKIIFAYSE